MVKQRYKSSFQGFKERRGADIDSDHHLVVTKIKMQLPMRKTQLNPRKKFNVGKLKQKDTKQRFQISLHNRFEVLQSKKAKTVEQRWLTLQKVVVGACKDVLERTHFKRKPWVNDKT